MNPESTGLAASLAALQERGAPQRDATRWLHITALARRAAGHQGGTRQVLDDKLATLMAASHLALDAATDAPARQTPPAPSALAGLLAHIATASAGIANPDDAPAPVTLTAARGAPSTGGLKSVALFGSTWSRLRLDQRMHQALATVPDNAGPLNTPRLLHQALVALRGASPEYLQHFVAHVEALLWLDQATQAPPPEAPKAPVRKPRGKAAKG
jgi:hypothetical protein